MSGIDLRRRRYSTYATSTKAELTVILAWYTVQVGFQIDQYSCLIIAAMACQK